MAAASGSVLQRCIVSPAGRHSASLIFLHGSGDSGQGLRMWIKQVLNQDLTFQHIKIIYPTAPPSMFLFLGGFSMGGCMAIHLAYRNHQDVAGVFALSSFLNKASAVYQALQKSNGVLPELFQCHGTADELVLHSWAEETNSMLKSLGVTTKFHSFPNVYHELSKTELDILKLWILTKLPGEMEKQK
ncbi:lysophospholipase-like protein 1 isoform b [Homo sapiens]|uniref:lysophospholipase-like protein 1 isoform b n=1 Tax=Homo sapiens TaxID=9606 RepID=UPI000387D9A2|nr:lysophospholipase-like protein 1 isoform b [Homo sapiens]|eukprot:NP_001287698.1 lysophospholipase-like protein 1 isoform b [Homo sapiens]